LTGCEKWGTVPSPFLGGMSLRVSGADIVSTADLDLDLLRRSTEHVLNLACTTLLAETGTSAARTIDGDVPGTIARFVRRQLEEATG